MVTQFEPVIGLEVHAELQTKSKMFCACKVVDSTLAEPNIAVCPVCAGMPGVLPVVNQKAVEFGLRVALALGCTIANTSIFARKNYFYPDLPKGYQISQYEEPLARNGQFSIRTPLGERMIRIRRVHLEEDTGKLTHVNRGEESNSSGSYTLVDLNRAGIPLLEIVTEPDLRSAEDARIFAMSLRNLLRYLDVNSGDMQKGVIRIEPNVSIRQIGSNELGTRTEIKNLNSFRALERGIAYEIHRQSEILRSGKTVVQQTMGWDEGREVTYSQRTKEEEDDYRYFPEPDLPPLVVEDTWVQRIKAGLPELPEEKFRRFREQYSLNEYDTDVLVAERAIADYFEQIATSTKGTDPKTIANWVTGELFGLMNQAGTNIQSIQVSPQGLGALLELVSSGEINNTTAKLILAEMFSSGQEPEAIVNQRGLRQVSDASEIANLVAQVLKENPEQVAAYRAGKETLANWFFGQVMRAAKGKANPQIVRPELERQLKTQNSG
jgi:aspartyl-tRNA(Asn)/glutamyl-tRNA(Gln) amidotransferase subunit B